MRPVLAPDGPPLEPLMLAGEMEALAQRGFTEHFTAGAGGLRAVNRGVIVPPEDVVIAEYRRFEGVSDPGDMAILYAVEARASGARSSTPSACTPTPCWRRWWTASRLAAVPSFRPGRRR